MRNTGFILYIEESAIDSNPPVIADLNASESDEFHIKRFDDEGEAEDWVERMSRLGSKPLRIVPPTKETVDASVVDEENVDMNFGEEKYGKNSNAVDDFINDVF